jgi:hypothetical protein
LGTFPQGTVRLSPGWGNRESDMDRVVDAMRTIAKRGDAKSGSPSS